MANLNRRFKSQSCPWAAHTGTSLTVHHGILWACGSWQLVKDILTYLLLDMAEQSDVCYVEGRNDGSWRCRRGARSPGCQNLPSQVDKLSQTCSKL